MSHGVREAEASKLIVNGFVESQSFEKLPMEYAVEMNLLIELRMEGCLRLGAVSNDRGLALAAADAERGDAAS
jgi:hypothetical protein